MKKVLFIIGFLGSGGISKSMVNLLNAMDRSKYEIHLLIMSRKVGDYECFVPADVIKHRIAEIGWISAGMDGLKELLFHRHLLLFLGSLLRMFLSVIDKSLAARLMAKMYPKLVGHFDTIIEYNGQQDMYYMVDKLEADRKVTFFHSDYAKYSYYYRADRKYYPKVDKIYTISETCADSLKKYFPKAADKVAIFENISLPSVIYRLAEEEFILPDYKGYVFVTVGLISYNKGFDLIVGAAKILRTHNIDFRWIMVGAPLADSKEYMDDLMTSGLKDNFIFTGVKKNPYPYMKRATIVVHTSRFEGKSIALDEAKILCKPIVVTNFSTVRDQFVDGNNACICKMSDRAVAEAIILLVSDKNLQSKYIKTLNDSLSSFASDFETRITKLTKD